MEEIMKFTKGKWYINKLYSYIGIYNHSTDKAIARLPYTSGDNAKLISKAPEMYEALKAFTNGLDIKNCSPSLMKIVELLKEIEA